MITTHHTEAIELAGEARRDRRSARPTTTGARQHEGEGITYHTPSIARTHNALYIISVVVEGKLPVDKPSVEAQRLGPSRTVAVHRTVVPKQEVGHSSQHVFENDVAKITDRHKEKAESEDGQHEDE